LAQYDSLYMLLKRFSCKPVNWDSQPDPDEASEQYLVDTLYAQKEPGQRH